MIHRYYAEYDGIALRPLWKCDLENLRQWRNDRELSRFLTPIREISAEQQNEWYKDYLENKDVLFFAVIDKNESKTIGSVALYDFRGKSCEVGKIMIGDASERGKGIGYYSLLMAICIGIQYLDMDVFHLNVNKDNRVAYSIYKRAGFEEIGQHPFAGGGTELEMKILRESFQIQNRIVKDICIYIGSGEK